MALGPNNVLGVGEIFKCIFGTQLQGFSFSLSLSHFFLQYYLILHIKHAITTFNHDMEELDTSCYVNYVLNMRYISITFQVSSW